ncbi:creatininase family protein [Fusibacter sp. 3D3]|uniref:creatininase family protein n=1 Tax=Fusibacter sp. 3D3 TaxID=1048380 RepID=UPI000852F1E2|nr:creatininase family protein [Fusibacter sp. 3D3]GAU79517.1 creatinine amidohydrolase [Fusibacter sp. 3D3]
MSKNVMTLSWCDIEALDKDKTVLYFGIAPIEQHGKHLPIGVDVYETEFWIHKSIELLEAEMEEYTFLTMPIVPYGYAQMDGFIGNLHLGQEQLYHLVLKSISAIAAWGIKHIVIISGHADPKHLIAIEQACDLVNQKYDEVAFSPMGAIFSGKVSKKAMDNHPNLSDKLSQFHNDFHAGWIETSCMLAIMPEVVKPNYKDQPNIEITDKEMILPEIVMAKTKNYGHLGFPKEATAELGIALNHDGVERINKCVSAFIKRTDYKQYEHHKLFELPFMKVKNGGIRNV